MYQVTKRIQTLYRALQDDLSRDIFWARLQMDLEPTPQNRDRLVSFCSYYRPEQENCRETLEEINRSGKKLILYGTSARGQYLANVLWDMGLDFYGFCGRRAAAFPDGLMGKPVVSPDWLCANGEKESIYVIISATPMYGSYHEILSRLREGKFPESHILPFFAPNENAQKSVQYFDFPQLIPKNAAFVDGGSFDGQDCIRFAECCGGQYTKIFAFEPDSLNYETCKKRIAAAGLANVDLIQAGLSDREGVCGFVQTGSMTSKMSDTNGNNTSNASRIRTVTIDRAVGDCTIGMIKMDIEGAEYAALQGAAGTIQRDRPFLALAVYHKPGDLLAIMDYCRTLVPDYHYWLRQYGFGPYDTVLYASVKVTDTGK